MNPTNSISLLARIIILCALLLAQTALAGGRWVTLQHQPPEPTGTMLLLSDGTVMAQGGGGGHVSSSWYKLTPDSTGSYTNGLWTNRQSMYYSRLYFSSDVLPDGRVFIAGAEYGNGTTNAEIYDPVSDSWTFIPVPQGLINTSNNVAANGANSSGFLDSGSVVLSDGSVLITPVGVLNAGEMVTYNPTANTWASNFLYKAVNLDESTMVKLPDDSILVVNNPGYPPGEAVPQNITLAAQRYIPSKNHWIQDGICPVQLYGTASEQGAAFLLPNGNAFFIGASTNTAIYVPSGNKNPGNWIIGPNVPFALSAPDAPAAMMCNGKILCALSPFTTNIVEQTTPTYFFEYDYTAGTNGTFTEVAGPDNSNFDNVDTYPCRMLDLPDGTVLFSDGNQSYIYIPDGVPLPAGKPTILNISPNFDGSYHLTGTGLNGISQGASYGDDAQMDSNYPLIRVTTGNGNVYYARTYNWSSTGVQTGTNIVSTEFKMPDALAGGGTFSLVVVANGIASDPVIFIGSVWVDFTFGGPFYLGTYDLPYPSLSQGMSAVPSNGDIFIKPGNTSERMTISKAMTLHAVGGSVTVGR